MRRPTRDSSPEAVLLYWIGERHAMYQRRRGGRWPPWTTDPILQAYRFTNVFRRLDRLTQALLADLARRQPLRDQLFRIALFRLFNWLPTYEALRGLVGRWDGPTAKQALDARKKAGEKLFTGVWMVSGACAQERGEPTHVGYLKSLAGIYNDSSALAAEVRGGRSLEAAHAAMQRYGGIGPFVGWQMVLDMTYTPLLEGAADADSFLHVGPGAVRGLMRFDGLALPEGRASLTPSYPGGNAAALARLKEVQAVVNRKRGAHVPRLSIHDVEHSLCEADKYARALSGEGRPRNNYEPSGLALPEEL